MVPLLFMSRGLRSEGDNEKKRKQVKRNEIQCIPHLNHGLLVLFRLKFVKKKIYYFHPNIVGRMSVIKIKSVNDPNAAIAIISPRSIPLVGISLITSKVFFLNFFPLKVTVFVSLGI